VEGKALESVVIEESLATVLVPVVLICEELVDVEVDDD